MKKILAMVMALVLMLSVGVFAEETETDLMADYVVLPGEKLTLDLNGDGVEEIFSCDIAYDDVNYIETAMLNVIGDGINAEYETELYMSNVYLLDIDGDGVHEIFLSGDEMSFDYVTYCMHFDGEKLVPVLFEDANRGENSPDNLFDRGYGLLMYADNGRVDLLGTQDILGTYFGLRTFELKDGMFVLADDGLWLFERDYMDDESWDYAGIAPKQDIPVTFVDENGAETEGVIAAGEKFMVTASDKTSVVYFMMQDGRNGYFAVEPDTEAGYGVKVNGVNEWELFDELPYAG